MPESIGPSGRPETCVRMGLVRLPGTAGRSALAAAAVRRHRQMSAHRRDVEAFVSTRRVVIMGAAGQDFHDYWPRTGSPSSDVKGRRIMTGERHAPAEGAGTRPWCLVWIDAREARLITWVDDAAQVEHLLSDVPAHRSSTGHVRHDPSFRHGGGGSPQTAGDPRRLEFLARFVDEVAGHIQDTNHVKILGPGETRERLADVLRANDRHHGVHREVVDEASDRPTQPQLIARLRELVGAAPRRRRAGGRHDLAAVTGKPHA